MEGYIGGKKSKGGPRRKWMCDIKEWTNIRECGQLKRKAQKHCNAQIVLVQTDFEPGNSFNMLFI